MEASKSLVSIIIPVYNGENYLRESIDSALEQTYDCIEILVINDGSQDKTEEVALSYGNRIRYFAKKNGGVSTALNTGILNMHGEYFSWLSHDDLYMPDKIKIQMEALSDNPTKIAYSDYAVINKDGAIIAEMNIDKKYPHADFTFGLFPILRQVLSGISLLIHKSHFERVGLFDERLRVTQDYDLWFKMLRDQNIVYINKPLVMHREHGAQVTHNYERGRIESDELWLRMLGDIMPEETCLIDGTERAFWDKQTEFLMYTPYVNSREYAKNRLKSLGGHQFHFRIFIRLISYKTLSTLSRLSRFLGMQKAIKKSKLFDVGYKMWFKVRYR